VVVRGLDELLNVVVPLLGQLDDLVNGLVASVLVLLRCESTANRLGLAHLLGLLHRQSGHTSLESESLEETTGFKVRVLVELAAAEALWCSTGGRHNGCTTTRGGRNAGRAEVMTEAAAVRSRVADVTRGRHLAEFTIVSVAVNWVGAVSQAIGIPRVVVWEVAREVAVRIVGVLQAVLVRVVGVRTGSRARGGSYGGRRSAANCAGTNSWRLNGRIAGTTCSSIDGAGGGSIGATGEEVGV